jgi:hypothetical protein
MNKIKILYLGFFAALVMFSTSCQKDLEVGNPNSPTLSGNVTEENGLTKLAQGGIYLNGLSYGDAKLCFYFQTPPYLNWSLANGHEKFTKFCLSLIYMLLLYDSFRFEKINYFKQLLFNKS